MKGIFIGKDGSMGFKHGKEYQFIHGVNATIYL